MRTYIEAQELTTEEDTTELDFIRIDLEDYIGTEEDCISDIRELMLFSSPHFIIRKHYCSHDEGESCRLEVIEEI